MAGRYGTDHLNRFLSVASLALFILSFVTGGPLLYPLAMLMLAGVLFRMFSRNAWKRGRENQAYLQIRGKAAAWFSKTQARYRQRKTHRFYKCRSCGATLRIPKGRGRVVVTCPKCKTTFEDKT